MKVAESSWLMCVVIISFQLVDILCSNNVANEQCSPLSNLEEWEHRENLIEDLAMESDVRAHTTALLGNLLEPYDATPFWYNLVQAISLASGITPTTEAIMHDLVTSSFQSEHLNSSIKTVLSFIKCNKNKTQTSDDVTTKQLEADLDDVEAGVADLSSDVRSSSWDQEQEAPGNALLGE